MCNNKTEVNILIWVRANISQLHSSIALTVGAAAAQRFCATVRKYNNESEIKFTQTLEKKNKCQLVILISIEEKDLYHSEQSE